MFLLTSPKKAFAVPPTPPAGYQWELTWSDDFNGSTFDIQKWRAKVGVRCEDAEGDKNPTYYQPDNVGVSNGTLKLYVRQENRVFSNCGTSRNAGYTGGMLSTNGNFDGITYGYFEARLKYNMTGPGFWANFWMNATNDWPPEFDHEIYSYYYGRESNTDFQSLWYKTGVDTGNSVTHEAVVNYRNWHSYGVSWLSTERVKFYVDDLMTYHSPVTNENPPTDPMSVILRAGAFVGPNYGGLPDSRTVWPGSAEYDWVRVYRLVPSNTTSTPTLTPTFTSTPTPTQSLTNTLTPTISIIPGNCIANLSVNDSANSADWSARSNLQVGDVQYGDRNYTFASIPQNYLGSNWIRTANDSKAYTGLTVASFTLTSNATVVIANDARITNIPAWLSSYSLVSGQIVNSEFTPISFNFYSKDFLSGQTVTLGQSGSHGNDFYTVIVRCQGNTPTPTIPSVSADANSDGLVNGIDYMIWLNHYNQTTSRGRIDGDFNNDRSVNLSDYIIWISGYEGSTTNGEYFTVSVADESFCLYSTNSQTIRDAHDNLSGLNTKHLSGNVLAGSGGFNYGYGGLPNDKYWRYWSWHMDPAQTIMADATIELCDGLPSAVEYGPLDTGNYCPWLSRIAALGCPTP